MQVLVVDKDRLARLCRRAERWEGSWRAAALQLGVGAGTFWRLREAAGGATLQSRTFDAFYHYLPPKHTSEHAMAGWDRDLFTAVLTPQAKGALDAYGNWLQRELRRFGKWDRSLEWVRPRPDGKDLYGACMRVLKELRRKYPAELAPLNNLFTKSRDRRTTDSRRLSLALLRIAEPLVAAEATNSIEPGPEELAQRDCLVAYLRAAVRREKILLDRAPDIERAAAAAEPGSRRRKRAPLANQGDDGRSV